MPRMAKAMCRFDLVLTITNSHWPLWSWSWRTCNRSFLATSWRRLSSAAPKSSSSCNVVISVIILLNIFPINKHRAQTLRPYYIIFPSVTSSILREYLDFSGKNVQSQNNPSCSRFCVQSCQKRIMRKWEWVRVRLGTPQSQCCSFSCHKSILRDQGISVGGKFLQFIQTQNMTNCKYMSSGKKTLSNIHCSNLSKRDWKFEDFWHMVLLTLGSKKR